MCKVLECLLEHLEQTRLSHADTFTTLQACLHSAQAGFPKS